MLKISFAGYFGLFPAISAQFTFELYVTAEYRKKTPTPTLSGVQAHSRSSMSIALKKLVIMISSMYVPIWNRFHA